MNIIVADTAGFCFGVNKAINTINQLLEDEHKRIYTLGPIIHNEQLVDMLCKKGVEVIEDVNSITEKGYVVIRAHGVTPDVYKSITDKQLEMIDLTCPYVKKIHKLVEEKYGEGYTIIIAGDKKHPEVIGINGWCENSAFIVNSIEDVKNIEGTGGNTCIVAQTTLTEDKWVKITEYIKKAFQNVIKFDTICNATTQRQLEGVKIASGVDMMIVIGGAQSSNTEKLYQKCREICGNTYKIETVGDLPPININNINNVGITAGASTPDWIIKEVIDRMEELNKEQQQETEINFKEAFEDSIVTLQSGKTVKGKIIGFNDSEIYVDLGYKCDGILPIEEYTDEPGFKAEDNIQPGDEIEVFILRVDDKEGQVKLSKKVVDEKNKWNAVKKAHKDKTPVEAEIVEVVKGGVIAVYNGLKIFIPASQVSDKYVKDLSEFLHKKLPVRIIEFNKRKQKVVGSHRIIVEEEKEAKVTKLWEEIEEGKEYKGLVTGLTDFGAFVDIGGVDGLIHLTELSWNKIKHPSQVVKTGDEVEVRVLEFDKEKGRVSLGYRKLEDNPWYKIDEKYKVGDSVKGKVVRLVPFGVFVELEKGLDGLVHISQISNKRIAKPEDVIKNGQEVEARVMEVDGEKKRLSLSIKEANPIDPPEPEGPPAVEKVEEKKPVRERKKKIVKGSVPKTAPKQEAPARHVEEMNLKLGDMLSGLDLSHFGEADETAGEPAAHVEEAPKNTGEDKTMVSEEQKEAE